MPMPSRHVRRLGLLLTTALVASAGCASQYTILERSQIKISDSARVSARNLVADAVRFPQVAEHLALAQEVYQRQLFLLKERRNKVRGRRRTFGIVSYAAMTAGALATTFFALAGDEMDASRDLQLAASVGLGTVGIGAASQVGSLIQEDTSSLDAKMRQLELRYDTMMERLRDLTHKSATPACDPSIGSACPAILAPISETSARMSEVIEDFITEAMAINVKG
jgi:hypothetical protein